MKDLTNNAYAEMVKRASPPSRGGRNMLCAFLVGGLICAMGEGLIHLYQHWGMEKDVAFASSSITLVFLSVMLTGLNVYDDIAKVGGAGTLVPITGFANAVASPAIEFKSEGLILGLGAKLFAIAGPVIVYGLAAGVVYGLVLWLFQIR